MKILVIYLKNIMYKIIISLFLSLFLVSCFWNQNSTKNEIVVNNENKVQEEVKILEIKNWLKISESDLQEVKNICNSYEKEYSWKDNNFIKNDIIDKTIIHIKEDLNSEKLQDYLDLKDWKITWVYSDFQDIDSLQKIYETNKYDKDNFYFYLGNYMLFINDKNIYEKYKNIYFEIVKSEKDNINENYIIPLFSTELAFSSKCNKIINDNFVSY